MPDKPWKRTERQIAAMFGMRRTPLSGSRSGHNTRADAIPDDDQRPTIPIPRERIYLEVKHSGGGRTKRPAAIITLFEDTQRKARREGKIPFVVNHGHRKPWSVVTIRLDHLMNLLTILGERASVEEILHAMDS